jgi:hypothetical protein
MKNLLKIGIIALSLFFMAACSKDEPEVEPIIAGDYPVKEYALERDPNVNVWGAGMDFIHSETKLAETTLDYKYLSETDTYTYDAKFYTVKAYYKTSAGETASEGCPAVLLASGTMGCKIGEGVTFFDSCSVISPEVQATLATEPVIDFSTCKNSDGTYSRDLLFTAMDKCLIGRSFRSGVLVVPDGKTEKEVQSVYLLKTSEGGYVKFMVKQFKGDKPNEKQTIVRWQVISE